MSQSRLFVLVVVLAPLAGCVWPPDSNVIPQPAFGQEASFQVDHYSSRELDGTEHESTFVNPESDYYNGYDSILYIVVNGDTAYRHPYSAYPPSYDSTAPYHFDGQINIVKIVFPASSTLDTSYEQGFEAAVTTPRYGDTLFLDSTVQIGYRASVGNKHDKTSRLSIYDSLVTYDDVALSEEKGIVSATISDFGISSSMVWVEVSVDESFPLVRGGTPFFYDQFRTVTFTREVAYPLQKR